MGVLLNEELGQAANAQGLPNHHKARPQAWPLTTERPEGARRVTMNQQLIAAGRNLYYEGQHGAEDPNDTAQRLALVAERDSLRAALKWYADGKHFGKSDADAWDTVSGEPQNWWCDEAGTAMIEDGTMARMVLDGKMNGRILHATEDEEEA